VVERAFEGLQHPAVEALTREAHDRCKALNTIFENLALILCVGFLLRSWLRVLQRRRVRRTAANEACKSDQKSATGSRRSTAT
jgi:hypothetical protein